MKQFTNEELDYILENWGKITIYEMKNHLHTSWITVSKVGQAFGLELPPTNEWTNEDIEQLKELAKKYNYKKIAEIMNRSENAVYLKARRLNIPLITAQKIWTKEDEETLKELWGEHTIESIAKKMGRTVFSIKVKVIRMHLGSAIENHTLSLTISEISEITGVSTDRINTWKNKGLKLQKIRIYQKKTIYGVSLEDLLKFLEENQDSWDATKVEPYALGYEPEWLINKRRNDAFNKKTFYRKWTKEEIEKAGSLYIFGKSVDYISVSLNRSPGAVNKVLKDLGLKGSTDINKESKYSK